MKKLGLFAYSGGGLIYLDHAATTPLHPAVLEEMLPYLKEFYGNPSGVHRLARASRAAIEQARERMAAALDVLPSQIIFTSGGTEADNLALFGLAHRGRHILVTRVEHHAVLHPAQELQRRGYDVTYLAVDKVGRVHPDQVASCLRYDTALVSVMMANNEVGSLQPIAEIGARCREKGILLHTDAVQAVGLYEMDMEKLGIQAYSLSAHKLNGPKGVGALVVDRSIEVSPRMLGGGQERGMRSGTENVAGIVGMARAVELAMADRAERFERYHRLSDLFYEKLLAEPGVQRTGHAIERHPGIISLTIEGAVGEAMLTELDAAGIAASTGSACSTATLEPSHVLRAMGVPLLRSHGSLRFSLGRSTTEADVLAAVRAVRAAIQRLRGLAPADLTGT